MCCRDAGKLGSEDFSTYSDAHGDGIPIDGRAGLLPHLIFLKRIQLIHLHLAMSHSGNVSTMKH